MKVVGLILEANPFHNGHQYLFNKVKAMFNDATIICVTSTSFTMRGEPSILNKFDKIETILNAGGDIIMELPINYTLQSADYFAWATVSILNKMGVTDIVIGSEITDIDKFAELYKEINSSEYNIHFKKIAKDGKSHKHSFSETLSIRGYSPDEIAKFNEPNFTLGFQYYRTIQDQNLKIQLHLIERTCNYYQKEATSETIASASYLRELYQKGLKIDNFIPYKPHFSNLTAIENNLMKIITFQSLKFPFEDPFDKINGNTEGIGNYILKNGDFTSTYQVLLDSLKNKRYSISRIRRIIISLLLGIEKTTTDSLDYLRIIGIDNKGIKYLNSLPKETKNLIFSSPNELKRINQSIYYEILATKLYGLLAEIPNLYLNEYKLPIRKKE